MIKEQKSKQKTRLKCILNLTFSSVATQQKCYDSVDLLISQLFLFFNHTFVLCIFIIILYQGLMTIIHHTFCVKVFVIQTKVCYFIAQHQTAWS